MRPESLKALGAVPLDADTARKLGLEGLMPGPVQILDELPRAVARVGRVVMDNPGQIALVTATSLVTVKILARAMRPDNLIEALALMMVASALLGGGFGYLTAKGYMTWRVRDESGQLVPLIPDP